MQKLNRRNFLAASATAVALPYFVPSTCFGANERINLGMIGVRNQGTSNLKSLFGQNINISALCDVDSEVRSAALKLCIEKGHNPKEFGDYRHVLDRKDVDAIVVTVPDHWHALMTMHGCEAGKDVYCEKPLSLTINEGRRMVDAARKHNRVVQTGSQQRSGDEFWKACTLIRNGAIGKIQKVLVGIPKSNYPGPLPENSEPPANLNYDMWLGPAPFIPYNEKRVHYNFRFWWDYSGGQITNFGAHHLDITQWALGMDDSGPIQVGGTATFNQPNISEVTETCRITYNYENGTEVVLGQLQEDIPSGCTFIGEKGNIYVNRGKFTTNVDEVGKLDPESLPVKLYRSKSHFGNFLECIKTREKPAADVEIGHRSATVCHLGNITARLGRTVKWDPKAEKFVDDAEAQAMTDRVYRAPYSHNMPYEAAKS